LMRLSMHQKLPITRFHGLLALRRNQKSKTVKNILDKRSPVRGFFVISIVILSVAKNRACCLREILRPYGLRMTSWFITPLSISCLPRSSRDRRHSAGRA
jgi:hypothetical protein